MTAEKKVSLSADASHARPRTAEGEVVGSSGGAVGAQERNGARRRKRTRRRTHINLFLHPIVDDFEETDDVGMSELLHDGDLLANLCLCRVEIVGEGEMVSVWGWQTLSPQTAHLLYAWVVALDGFHGLEESVREGCDCGEDRIGATTGGPKAEGGRVGCAYTHHTYASPRV